ncbi:MAG: hypothetical protein B7Y99_03150 [Caulobacterales bacterium 32-69-10]|nr:MAG: hypothetical protein B7Y99_03150 [Caulobacterales bacterium 32-69-10]
MLARLSQVERFIAPSRFLADRYAEWGIARERLAVIENILPVRARAPTPPRPAAYSDDRPLRLGYFGQFTPYKGLDVLLKAMNQLPAAAGVTLTIFGAANGEANRAWFEALGPELDKAGARVSLHGPYRNEDAGALLQTVDWVVAPSVWWENSPLVIQEARVAGVPVLVSHIGGMAEKVEPGVDGAHFVAGSSASLAERIMQIRSGALTATAAPIDPEAANAARLNDLCALYAGLTRAGEGA